MNGRFKTSSALIVLVLLAFAGFIRFYDLSRDPPESMGLHFISDEGWWVHNARNKILFDRWILDDFNQSLLVSPTFCFATYCVYSVWGVGFASSRFVPALSGWLSPLLLFFILAAMGFQADRRLLSLILLGTGFAFCAVNRIAFVDSTAFLFVLATWFFLEKYPRSAFGVSAAGITAGLAVMTKSYSLILIPVLVLITVHRFAGKSGQRKRLALSTLWFVGGFLLVGAAWVTWIYLPFQEQYRVMYYLWRDGNIPSSAGQIPGNLTAFLVRRDADGFHLARFVGLNMSLMAFAWWRLLMLFAPGDCSVRNCLRKLRRPEMEALIWLVGIALIVAPLTAKPFRRYIFLYPPLVVLGSGIVEPGSNGRSKRMTLPLKLLRTVILLSLPSLGAVQLTGRVVIPGLVAACIGLACLFSRIPGKPVRTVSMRLALTVFILMESVYFIPAIVHPSYSLRDTSRRLGREYLTEGTTILGGISDTLTLETSAKAVSIWGRQEAERVLNENPMERYRPDYIVVMKTLDGNPWGIEERYTRYLEADTLLQELRLLPTASGTYRVTAHLHQSPRSAESN
ncbi:phospholipid carrier-dependent glycosyltransferase [bacterium]|nr:phospholipid carrier-dependent glycosyltransferase [candidate division CSSED10-310 bacterium]